MSLRSTLACTVGCRRTRSSATICSRGCTAAWALASDIVFYEEFPAQLSRLWRRAFRWIRGDWQLLPWLGRMAPSGNETRLAQPAVGPRPLEDFPTICVAASFPLHSLHSRSRVGCGAGQALIWTALTVAAPGAYLFTDLVTSLARGHDGERHAAFCAN